MRWRTLQLAVISVAILATGCGSTTPTPQAAKPQTSGPRRDVNAAFLSDPPALVSVVAQVTSGGRNSLGLPELRNMINSGLTIAQDGGVIHPRLGEAVPSLENGLWRVFPDGRMETTYTIREGARWHDGRPFTSDDLVFTADVVRDRDLPLVRDVGFDLVDQLEVLSPRTVTVKWKTPYIDADNLFEGRLLVPRHLLAGPYADDKTTVLYHPYWTTEYVGLGPYKVREFERSSHLVLDSNPDYLLGRPKIDTITIRFFLDPNALSASLLAGAVDVTIGQTLSLEAGLAVANQWSSGRMETSAQAAGLPMHIFPQFINPSPPVILDVRFRKALYHALDRQELIESQMHGRAIPADGILWDPGSREWPDISSRVVTYAYDLQRATQMIESIGYTRGSDGFFRETGTNTRLSVELRTLTSFDSAVKAIYPIASYWERAGVGVETLVVPQQLQNDRQYRAERPGFDLPVSPRDLTRHHSAEVALPENSFRGANRSRYMNPEFDALIERYFTTIPWRERMDALGQVVHHMTDQVTVMGVYFDIAPVMVANRLHGVKGRPGGTEVWNIHEWEIRR